VTELPVLLALGLVLLLGSMVQSSLGFGINVVAGPVVLLAAPELMPGALVIGGLVLPVVQLAREGLDVAWRPLGWSLLARALTTPVGVWLVLVLSPSQIGLVLGVVILLTVALSIWSIDIRPTLRNALVAGALSGISGASAAVGGPFAALLFQHERPHRMRSTLAVSFIAGSALSALGLAQAGQLGGRDLWAALIWTPFMIAGYAASGRIRRRLAESGMRRAVLGFCVVSALVIVVRALLTT
jgi:uncharacterized membrane protein YfcA